MSSTTTTFDDPLSQRYHGKHILAPMVRVGTLPMRMLALKYGADLVYTPEIIDKRIVKAQRRVNPTTGIIEYVNDNDTVDLQIHPREKPYVIFQVGTSDPDLALEAALKVASDVSGIDVNCGCPKKFSIQGGMGAALLTDPERLEAILKKLVDHSGLPVTCKIRLLDNDADTLALVQRIEKTGVKALAVHCRTRNERPRDRGHWDKLKMVAEAVRTIPVIANGDVFTYDHLLRVKEECGVSSAMVARGAMENPSMFSKDGLVDAKIVAQEYISLAVLVNNRFQNTKYTLMQMYNNTKSTAYQNLTRAKNHDGIMKAFGLKEMLKITVPKLEIEPNTSALSSSTIEDESKENYLDPSTASCKSSVPDVESNEPASKRVKLNA
ncbi:tRNA-dihydrouridine synthase 2 [Dispira parvispora]|uniref:tRNA-dihydrouridine synthase 2 n=1 Tax=Dispira parvispora TaxID=1520584 RepID=A0A9W8AIX8_9FUNG|nr:tRNA-dihydrouridine synthase 2 [Dispira parvispora]